MQSIAPCLVFNNQAEDAVKFYVSIFRDSKILRVSRFSEKEIETLSSFLPEEQLPGPAGSVKAIAFVLKGQEFHAANGGPFFKFSHGISLYVNCETQEEIDFLWARLSDDGETEQCGWLKDKYGVSWQIAPADLNAWVTDPNTEVAQRVSLAVLHSKKYSIEELRRAYEER